MRPDPDDQVGSIDTPPGRCLALEDIERLGDSIAELAARIQAATYELVVLILAFDARDGWSDGFNGFRSCAYWLNWRTGLDLGAAREKVRVVRALADLPRLGAAMRLGELSYFKGSRPHTGGDPGERVRATRLRPVRDGGVCKTSSGWSVPGGGSIG